MKKVFVTGASRGIGHAVMYRLLAMENVQAIPVLREDCDITDSEQVRLFFRPYQTDKEVWGLVHCAGIAWTDPVLGYHTDKMRELVTANVLGTMYVNKWFGQLLTRSGGRPGRIINFSSISVPLAIKGEAVYGASKAAVEAFSRTFAREIAGFGVTVNCIAPGPVATDMTAGLSTCQVNAVVNQQLVQRAATKDEVATVVEWLLSEQSALVTGATLNIGGV